MKTKQQPLHYISHAQNNSPAKLSFSFSKTMRFCPPQSSSPAKFYERPSSRSRRTTSMGFGEKINMQNKHTGDPGLYNIRSTFHFTSLQKRRSSSTFGSSHSDIYNRELSAKKLVPGPAYYHPKTVINSKSFQIGEKLKNLDKLAGNSQIGPQTYQIKPEIIEKCSKFKANKGYRIKTQTCEVSRYNISKFDNRTPAPNRYNPESILNIEALIKKRQIRGAGRFSKDQRMKPVRRNGVGPGSYECFSVFGETL